MKCISDFGVPPPSLDFLVEADNACRRRKRTNHAIVAAKRFEQIATRLSSRAGRTHPCVFAAPPRRKANGVFRTFRKVSPGPALDFSGASHLSLSKDECAHHRSTFC